MAGQRNDLGKRSNSQSDYGGGKRRNLGDEPDQHNAITQDDTVYRYLYPLRKIGSIIGRGGEIAKQLRADSKANIRISDSMLGFEERIVTIYSTSDQINLFGDSGQLVAPAMDALVLMHDWVVEEDYVHPQLIAGLCPGLTHWQKYGISYADLAVTVHEDDTSHQRENTVKSHFVVNVSDQSGDSSLFNDHNEPGNKNVQESSEGG